MKAVILLICTVLTTAGGILGAGADEKSILVLGDSLSAGYGLDPDLAYPALLETRLRAGGYAFKVINAGVSGDTSAGGLGRINWLLKNRVDILLLELGANDGLRGIPLDSTKSNLQGIIDRTQARYPEADILIAGMMVPPNLGPEYTGEFRQLFIDLARENGSSLIPFLLEGVAGDPKLNLPDGIHPTAEGHKIVLETVWRYLEPLVKASSTSH